MANPRYNTQVTNQRGGSARVGKMGGGMMMQRPMYKRGGGVTESQKKQFKKNQEGTKKTTKKVLNKVKDIVTLKSFHKAAERAQKKALAEGKTNRGTAEPRLNRRVKKMAGGRIAGAARRAQEHGYYTPDMGMKGGKMFRDGGKVGKKKPRVKVIGIGKAKDYPGIKKIIEMNKKGKKRFKDGGSAMKPVDKSKNPGLAKLPTQVRNKMGYMKDGGKVKSKGSEHPLAGRQGNLLHKLKSQKQIKAITDTKKYKDASYNEKNKMLQAGGAYTKSAPDKKGRISRRDGGNTSRMNRLEELGRVDAERGFTRKGKRNLKAEKKRIVKELRR